MSYTLFEGRQDATFESLVAGSNNTYSVLYWTYNSMNFKLYPQHVVQTDSDSDYIYELYWTSSFSYNGTTCKESYAQGTNTVACVRYKKTPEGDIFDIYVHDMLYSDFTGVFGGNLKDSNIYSWHGSDYCMSYYWHGYDDSDKWKIIDGNLPFLSEFPQTYTIDDAPAIFWRIVDGNLPFRSAGYPQMYNSIDEAPISFWRIIDGKLPFRITFPKMYDLTPEHSNSVLQGEYICVYDMHNPQNKFNDNGIAILMPTKAEINEELNGAYELTLEHPIDAEGRWSKLLELNIIKAEGQLFRIYSKQTKLNSDNSKLRTVKARHIFYDLNDKLLEDVRPENKNGLEFIDWIMTHTYNDDPDGYYPQYNFSYNSDIVDTATSYFIGSSVTGALLGEDNCFVNRFGGEIYRDNFYFSINEHKEGSQQEAFNIRYGVDMIDVEETIDYSDMMTNLIAKDNFGHSITITHGNTPRIAHHISKSVIFSYENEEAAASFEQDARNYFAEKCYPKINYKVNYANLKNADLYKDFIGLQNCNVGDTGYVYCEELGITTLQKIVKKTTDILSGNTVSIELGNMQNSLTRKDKYSTMVYDDSSAAKAAAAAAEEARKAFASSLKTWGDCFNYKWKDLRILKWQEVYKTEVSNE